MILLLFHHSAYRHACGGFSLRATNTFASSLAEIGPVMSISDAALVHTSQGVVSELKWAKHLAGVDASLLAAREGALDQIDVSTASHDRAWLSELPCLPSPQAHSGKLESTWALPPNSGASGVASVSFFAAAG